MFQDVRQLFIEFESTAAKRSAFDSSQHFPLFKTKHHTLAPLTDAAGLQMRETPGVAPANLSQRVFDEALLCQTGYGVSEDVVCGQIRVEPLH